MKPLKIVIAGIGAVGGYFGGLLARQYHHGTGAEIHFIARGAHLQEIRKMGLHVITPEETFTASPASATDHPEEIGICDFLLVCTKSYDLESVVHHVRPCIGKHSVILPLLNGVDGIARINTLIPDVTVWQGFVYVIARLKAPGVVENLGNIQKLYFGLDSPVTADMRRFETLLCNAGVEAMLSDEISTVMWEKFIFISPLASLTSYLDKTRGEIMENAKYMNLLTDLIDEVIAVAQYLNVRLHEDIRVRTLRRLHSLPHDATSSMHDDFKNERRTELESLTGYVVDQGRRSGVSTPVYAMIYEMLNASGGRGS